MKNKLKFWRRMTIKQYDGTVEIRTGRRLRDVMRDMNQQKIMSPIHTHLFRTAGIRTPVFDNL